MITVSNLQKRFGNFEALRGIDLHVQKGEIYGFIGRNGAGKSTTMNILAGLSRPSGGSCIVNGMDVHKVRHPSLLHIGYLPEEPKFYTWMSAYETLHYLGSGGSHRVTPARIEEMLRWVGLADSARRRVGGFSRGMRQRLGLASAMVHDPELLILDEPSSALDPEGRSDVLRLIRELRDMGKTVLFSSHILSDVQRVCDRVGIIVSGKMTLEKTLEEIRRDNLAPVYDITADAVFDNDLLEELRKLKGVTGVRQHHEVLSVSVADTEGAPVRLMQFFGSKNIPLQGFALRVNDLEDIFIREANGK